MSIDEALPILPEMLVRPGSPFDPRPVAYPSILQSFGIAGAVVGLGVLLSPLIFLAERIGMENAVLVYYSFVMGLAFLIIHRTRKSKTGTSTFHLRFPSLRIVPMIVFGTVVLLFGIVAPIASLVPMPEMMKKALQAEGGRVGYAALVYFVILAPILEELIFRGIMLDGLLKRYRPLTAILLSSFLFGAVHLNPWQFVTGLVLGCFFGWVYLRTGSVGCCILGHMTANGSGYILRLATQASGQPIDVSPQPAALARLFAFACPVVFLTVYVMNREFGRDRYTRVGTVAFSGDEALQGEPDALQAPTPDAPPS